MWYFCLDTEKTATLGKNCYTVTDSIYNIEYNVIYLSIDYIIFLTFQY